MEPVDFKGASSRIAENQPEYLTLPAHIDEHGIVTSCWSLCLFERVKVFFTGKVYVQQMTFGKNLQPQKVLAEKPTLSFTD